MAGIHFSNREDAIQYLRDLSRLWIGWLFALAALTFTRSWLTIVAGVVVLWVLYRLARPLQERVDRILPIEATATVDEARGRRTDRDRLLRSLAYGVEPIREASDLAAVGSRWLVMRHVILAATAAAFLLVIVDFVI
ncbi:MAG TPA: hypothetical protein VGC47_14555 [Acidimicrobiia bacterium]|jgi:hypothetical protein